MKPVHIFKDNNGNMRAASTLEKDVNAHSDIRANCNITKPDYVINFLPAIAIIKNFRLSIIKVSVKNSIDDKR